MENLLGPGLEQGQLALPLSHSSILHKMLLRIAEFSALALERRINPILMFILLFPKRVY